jgi:hypothetical protein
MGFDRLTEALSKKKGIRNPAALAASIGRKKYTKKRFQEYAAKGKKMRGAETAK